MKKRFFTRITAVFMMSVMSVTPVLADEIKVETEKFQKESSLLGEFLGSDELGQNIREKGIESGISLKLQEEFLDAFYLGRMGQLFVDCSGELGIMWNPADKCWNLHMGTDFLKPMPVDVDLYGDTEQLLLSCNPFYDGTIGIKAGSLEEQFKDSGLEEFLIELLELEEDLNLSDRSLIFYPDGEKSDDSRIVFGGLKRKIKNKLSQLKENIRIEKDDENGEERYLLSITASDAVDFVFPVINEILGVGVDVSLANCADALELIDDILWSMKYYQSYFGDDITVEVIKKDGRFAGLNCNTTIKTENYNYDSEGNRNRYYEGIGISCELNIPDPEKPMNHLSLFLNVENKTSQAEPYIIGLTLKREEKDTKSHTSVAAMIKEGTEIVYAGVPFTGIFDTETGEFDAVFSVKEDGTEIANVSLESVYTDVRKGEGFVWKMEDLSISDGEETYHLLEGSIWVNTKLETKDETESSLMVGDASKGEIFTVVSEALMNYQEWMNQYNRMYYGG